MGGPCRSASDGHRAGRTGKTLVWLSAGDGASDLLICTCGVAATQNAQEMQVHILVRRIFVRIPSTLLV